MNINEIEIPKNIESEKSVLNAMLKDSECLSEAIATISDDDFFVPLHKTIFISIQEAAKSHGNIDFKVLSSYMMDKKLLSGTGDIAKLAEIFIGTSTPKIFDGHRKILKDKSAMRKLIESAKKMIWNVIEGTESSVAVEEAENSIRSINDNQNNVSVRHISGVVGDLRERVEKARLRNGRPAGIPTGFTQLDSVISGLKEGELILIAARPGVGKTVLGLNFTSNMIFDKWNFESNCFMPPGYRVGFFSLEMPDTDLVSRLIAKKYAIPQKSMQRGTFDDETYKKFIAATEDIVSTNVFFADTTSLTSSKLQAEIRRLRRSNGADIVFVDYIQLIDADNTKMPRHLQVAQISRTLKRLALELRIPIVAMAQISREGVDEPQIHHLRESGSLEADADIVIILHRKSESSNFIYPTQIRIAKNRNGAVCPLQYELNGITQSFRELTREEQTK